MSKTMTLMSWNVNGIRAVHRKKVLLPWIEDVNADIICFQETKAELEQLPEVVAQPDGYHGYWNHATSKKGYSGTGLLSREEPLSVEFGLGQEEFDQEGRTIIARYPAFTLINCYFPNGGRGNKRVPFKLDFCEAFLAKCEAFRAEGQHVIFCGDVNTSHQEIDLANPASNRKNTGFLPEERAWVDKVIETGYIDTFRHFHPDQAEQYTWWSMPTRARERNIGWRLDYFFVNQELLPQVAEAFITADVMGSDHCPVGLRLNLA